AHAAVIFIFVRSLSVAGQRNDDIARLHFFCGHQLVAAHTAGHGAVYYYRSYHIAYIGSFPTQEVYIHTILFQPVKIALAAIDEFGYYFSRYQVLVPAYGAGISKRAYSTYTQQIVYIHHNGVDSNAFPNAGISCFLPV